MVKTWRLRLAAGHALRQAKESSASANANVAMNWKMAKDPDEDHGDLVRNIRRRPTRHESDVERYKESSQRNGGKRWRNLVTGCSNENGATKSNSSVNALVSSYHCQDTVRQLL